METAEDIYTVSSKFSLFTLLWCESLSVKRNEIRIQKTGLNECFM